MTNKFMAAIVLAALALLPARSQSVSDLLQRGIYAQQAAGDLDSAIQLFRQAVNSTAPSRTLAAQALFHMGSAQAAKGDLGAAAQTFRELIDRYPEQRDLAGRLQQYLPAYKPNSAEAGFTATLYHDPGTSGVSFVLPTGWTANQDGVDSTKKGIHIFLNSPGSPEPESSMGIWVRTRKIDPATLEHDIAINPDLKEEQMRKAGTQDFTIRRETVRRIQVGAARGSTAVADFTEAHAQLAVITRDGQTLTAAQQGALLDSSARAVANTSSVPVQRAEIFVWLWGNKARIAAWATNIDPKNLAAVQAQFESILNTIVIP